MSYAADVGIFCNSSVSDNPTDPSMMGAWKRTRSYCPSGLNACSSIVANLAERTANPPQFVTGSTALPPLAADVMLPQLQNGESPSYTANILFTSYNKRPEISVFRKDLIASAFVSEPTLLSTDKRGNHTFSSTVTISPAPLFYPVYVEELQRLSIVQTTPATSSTQSDLQTSISELYKYLAKPSVNRFEIVATILDSKFGQKSRVFTVTIKRPTTESFYPPKQPTESADGSSADGSSADGSSADGSSADGSSADGSSADGSSADGSSADGSSADGSSADGSSANGSVDSNNTSTS
jgi:hypothetical protein